MMTENSSFWTAMLIGYGTIIALSFFAVRLLGGRNKIFDFLGLEFILRKFKPREDGKEEKLPTGVIWALGIYVALFGIASQRYENRVDILEYKHTSYLTTVAAGAPFVASKLSDLELEPCPEKPDILNPFTIFRSMFWPQSQYPEFEGLLIRTVQEWKAKLSKADLRKADLRVKNRGQSLNSEL